MKKCVAVLAPPEGWEPLCSQYKDEVEFVFVPPLTSIPKDDAGFSDFLMNLFASKFDVVLMTCPTVVKYSISMASERGLLNKFLSSMGNIELIVIGKRTEESAKWNGLKVSSISPEVATEALIKHVNSLSFRGNIAILRSDRGSKMLPTALSDAGWNVTEVPVCSLQLKQSEDMEILLDRLEKGEISTLAFPTPSHAEAFFYHLRERFEDADVTKMFENVTIAVLGHETKNKLEGFGVEVDIMPKVATAGLLIKEIIEDLKASKHQTY